MGVDERVDRLDDGTAVPDRPVQRFGNLIQADLALLGGSQGLFGESLKEFLVVVLGQVFGLLVAI